MPCFLRGIFCYGASGEETLFHPRFLMKYGKILLDNAQDFGSAN